MSFDLDKKFEHMAILHEGIWYVPVHLIEDARRAQASASPVAEWVNREQGFQYLVEPPLPDGTKLYTASASPSSTDAAGPTAEQASVPDDLSAHEDMARDAVAAVASMPRKDLKAAHAAAVEDLLYWRRRALTAEVSAGDAAVALQAKLAGPVEEVVGLTDYHKNVLESCANWLLGRCDCRYVMKG